MIALAALLLAFAAMLPHLYLGALGVLAMRRPRAAEGASRERRFCIIIPAHNEASRIGALLGSIQRQQYKLEPDTIVVADNCTDDTARIASSGGAMVIERTDAERRGKGYALAAGLEHLPPRAEAVLFVDGDCTMSANTLAALNAVLARGERVVQARYVMEMDGPDAGSATGAIRRLALALVHTVRPLAKDRYRASAGLKGSGMCFERSLIDALGWRVSGLAEDAEQHIELLQSGARVAYAHDAVVTGAAPTRLADATGQHERWEAGRMATASAAPRLLAAGIRRRSVPMLDGALDLLLPPLSVLVAVLAAATAAAVLVGDFRARLVSLAGWLALGLYLVAGMRYARLRVRDIAGMTITAPVFAAWKLALYVRTLVRRPDSWEPTRRD